MRYVSTNGKITPVSLEEAVMKGLADDGGLFMPAEFPQIDRHFFERSGENSFPEIALLLAGTIFAGDLDHAVQRELVTTAFDFTVPLVRLATGVWVLELFHGPTLSFKDFGARFMARLLGHFSRGANRELLVIVATSGDTGSAVAHGFFGVPGVRVVILYPKGRVSFLQEQQLTTQGGNITALEVEGSFDDCQRLAKEALRDQALSEVRRLTSANSINIARLYPQMFFYLFAAAKLLASRDPIVCVVPSGNFGNLSAGLLARRLGVPISHFVAATNRNDVVPEYLDTGVYRPRESERTLSSAMDVGNPSNFARIKALFDGDPGALKDQLSGYRVTDIETRQVIRFVRQIHAYFLDPHTAVAYQAARQDGRRFPGACERVLFGTADPAKFPEIIKEVTGEAVYIPERLAEYGKRKKCSIVLPPTIEAVRETILAL